MKNKYNDNKLAEEFDWIILTDDSHAKRGLANGALGTLISSYTGKERPLYAEFALADGSRLEEPLALNDFRVLDERNTKDLLLVANLRCKERERKAEKLLDKRA